MAESTVMRRMWVALSRAGCTLFRNNVAQGIAGRATWIRQTVTLTLQPGDVVVRQGRVLHAGLTVGSGDLIGWTPVVVTPEMVGQTVAVFTSIESKDGKGRSTKEQVQWREIVQKSGGFAGEARNDVDALVIVGK